MTSPPPFLYKYKPFGNYLLDELCQSSSFFASPRSFNDPLDSKPSISDDELPMEHCQELLSKLEDEHGPWWNEQITPDDLRFGQHELDDPAAAEIAKYRATLLKIENLLHKDLGQRGILSLAEDWNCPLMWSHYTKDHQGVCLEFSTRDHIAPSLMRVQYGGKRAISLPELYAWKVKGSTADKQNVLERAFFTKSSAWSYEKEWRILSEAPALRHTPLELSGVHFGACCSPSLRTVIVKTLHDSSPNLKFYQVFFSPMDFELHRVQLNTDQVLRSGVSPNVALVFERSVAAWRPPIGEKPIAATKADGGPPYFY